MVVFLASDLAAGITGRIFGIQGNFLREYKMTITDGVAKPEGMWTAQEIAERLDEITG
jgi:hypothetical protein